MFGDSSKREKFVEMKMIVTNTIVQNVEDRATDIMDDIVDKKS